MKVRGNEDPTRKGTKRVQERVCELHVVRNRSIYVKC